MKDRLDYIDNWIKESHPFCDDFSDLTKWDVATIMKDYAQQQLPTEQEITAEAKKRYAHWPQKQVEFTEGAMFVINKES